MKRSTKYVGLDVHQATTVASVREESGRVIARAVVPTEGAALLEFFSMSGSAHVTLEEGTQARWLHDLLSPRVHRYSNLRWYLERLPPRRAGTLHELAPEWYAFG